MTPLLAMLTFMKSSASSLSKGSAVAVRGNAVFKKLNV